MTLDAVRSDYLRSSVEALWPNGDVRVTRRPGPGDERAWWILPSRRRPRLLVPVTVPEAATMLRRHDARRRDAVARRVLEGAVASRALLLMPVSRLRVAAPGGIVEHLASVLGRPVRAGVLLGRDRPNRKPVLRVFSAQGDTLAFLKVADGRVGELVRAEAQALQSIASTARKTGLLQVPRVLHSGQWEGLQLLLLSPLTASQSRRSDDDPELAAALEVAQLVGLSERPVRDLVNELRARADRMDTTPELTRTRARLDSLLARAGDRGLWVGGWHGDWSPWNMGRHRGRLQAWDWERFAAGVPVGYDAVHHRSQLLWRDHVPAADCRPALLAAARDMLALAQLPESDAEPVVELYLVEILLRYLQDQPLVDPLRPRTAWVLDQLDAVSLDGEGMTGP
ncbi:MAG: hypothetical protein M3419_01140 [Actinomycetota bacterium]|nr:hypothetical protein [Actinomycetota bacterium]